MMKALARRGVGLWWRLKWGNGRFARYQRANMNGRARHDPKEAVGGMWEEMGAFQLALLRDHGLEPTHTLLDIGCGSLRGGRKLISYLEPGNYTGTELSEGLLEAGQQLITDEGLSGQAPNLVHTTDFRFDELAGQQFDYALAFGVFTDSTVQGIRECFAHIGPLLGPSSIFLATFGLSSELRSDPVNIRFMQPFSFFEEAASAAGLRAELAPGFSHRHPKGHSLIRVTRRAT